jgi:hypothetical protein
MVEIKLSTANKLAALDKSIHPQPAKYFIPSWFKNMPVKVPLENADFKSDLMPFDRTVKACPSMHDVFHNGVVFVSPCDVHLLVVKNEFTGEYDCTWHTPSDDYNLEIHKHVQMTDHVKSSGIKGIFKYNYPFAMYAPKGYSAYQMPMIYHYEQMKDWHVPYGIVDVDRHHELNPQIMFTSNKDEIIIKKGTPLCYDIVFKREDYEYNVVPFSDELRNKSILSRGNVFTHFKNGYLKSKNKDSRK